DTPKILREFEPGYRVIYSPTNSGFAGGQNQAMRVARGEWILCLNPDVLLKANFVSNLVAAGLAHPEVGAICGKLLRWQPEAMGDRTNVIDSTGAYFTPNMRHLDRGAEEVDRGQYDRVQYVFAASGAALMFRREFISAVSVNDQFFDEDFFSFREDGDLAWRAQLMGHKYLYTPFAIAWHVRRVTPERRKDLPHVINWHSVKNRWLMRAKNASWWLCLRLAFPTLWRDVQVFGYALLRDRSMISACLYRWRREVRHGLRVKREIIQSRRKVSDDALVWWFSNTPRALDVPGAVAAVEPALAAEGLLSGESH
ncbi:MAG: glycosyltransferase, partial [Candidatus Eremiobacteraeota bacterium]|nr:glycosyltransferase [Candidatus Eremiobacteraeota bacterium]